MKNRSRWILFIHLGNDTKDVLVRSLRSLVVRGAGAGFRFAFTVVLARAIGSSGLGVFSLALTIVSVGAVIGRLGLDDILLRYVARNSVGSDTSPIRKAAMRGLALGFASGASASIFVLVLAVPIGRYVYHDAGLIGPLRIMALSIVPSALLSLFGSLLKGLSRPAVGLGLQNSLLPMTVFAALFGLRARLDTLGAAWVYTVASSVAAGVAGLVWTAVSRGRQTEYGAPSGKELILAGAPLLWVTLLLFLNSVIDVAVLGIFRPPGDVGIFAAATRVALLLSFVIAAFNSVLAPKIAVCWDEGDTVGMIDLVRKSIRVMLVLSAPVVFFLVGFPGTVLGVFGHEFSSGATALRILVGGQLINIATGAVGQVLTMTGHQNHLRTAATYAAIGNLSLNFILVPSFGMVGAALGTTTAIVVSNVIAVALVRKHLGVWVSP